MSAKHFVYLIECGGYVKIGHSHAPEKRLRQLDVGPIEASVVHTWVFDERKEAVRMEAKLHKLFDRHRVRGEWFKLDKEWPMAVADAALRFDGASVRELLETLGNIRDAEEVIADFEYEEDEEEADVWRSVREGYIVRAKRFGLPESEWDKALENWKAA